MAPKRAEPTHEFTLTMIGNNPICDLECQPSEGEPIIGAGDPRSSNKGPLADRGGAVNYYQGNTRPNPNYKPGKCIITGDSCCGHPMRNALQPQHMRDPAIVRRWLQAKKHLKMEIAETAANA